MARAGPSLLVRDQDIPPSNTAPMRAKAVSNLPDCPAIIMSPDRARPQPAPAAAPFRATTTGTGTSRMARIRRLMPAIIRPSIVSRALVRPPPERSAPAQKPRPLPVNRMARADLFSTTSITATVAPCTISPDMAFICSGRFRVRDNSPSFCSIKRSFIVAILPQSAL